MEVYVKNLENIFERKIWSIQDSDMKMSVNAKCSCD
jgi:hypothetical protein